MYAEVYGDAGPVVLLVHGIGGTGNVWGPQVAALRRSCRLIVPDLAGCGRSKTDPAGSADDYVQDLTRLLEEHEALSVHLVGHSFGSNLCQRIAIAHPDRATSLSVLGGSPGNTVASTPHPLQLRADRVRKEGIIGVANETVTIATSKKTQAARPLAANLIREMVISQEPEGYASICEAAATAPSFDSSRIACPALLVTGSEDKVTPPSAGTALHALIPRSEFRVLSDCGHWASVERHGASTQLLLNFIFAHS